LAERWSLSKMDSVENMQKELHDLVIEQRGELQSEQFQPISIESRKCILDEFKKSKRFRQVFNEATNYVFSHIINGNRKKVMEKFAGKLFQDLAYHFLASKQLSYHTLLSPEKTLEFYKKLYPTKPEVKHIFRLTSLDGISVPDGMLIEERGDIEYVIAICEYTLAGNEQKFKAKDTGFSIDKKNFEQLFGDANLLFVMPKGYYDGTMRNTGIEIVQMPFTHKQFRNFFDGIYKHYQLSPIEGCATLLDIQERVKWQVEEMIKHINNKEPLTLECMHYLSRMGEEVEKHYGLKTTIDYSILWSQTQ